MPDTFSLSIDWSSLFTCFLLFTRYSGVFMSLPGIGTEEVPMAIRVPLALILAAISVTTGAHVDVPDSYIEGGLMVCSEFCVGFLLGAVPYYIVASLAVAGQVTAATIGLGQATLIDPSIGEPVSVLSRLQSFIAVSVFLAIDGHHAVLRAAMEPPNALGIGTFRPDSDVAMILVERLSHTFELAVTIAGPTLVAILLAQFVLGLLTKFVPQVNVFIVSLPLTIGLGLFILAETLPMFRDHFIREFGRTDEITAQILRAGAPGSTSGASSIVKTP